MKPASKIQVSIRNVYGNDQVYPECPIAKLFADIAGTKTLTLDKMRLIERLGVQVEVMAFGVAVGTLV
jgi:hypothetical protein